MGDPAKPSKAMPSALTGAHTCHSLVLIVKHVSERNAKRRVKGLRHSRVTTAKSVCGKNQSPERRQL
jgi:hypothetical protein